MSAQAWPPTHTPAGQGQQQGTCGELNLMQTARMGLIQECILPVSIMHAQQRCCCSGDCVLLSINANLYTTHMRHAVCALLCAAKPGMLDLRGKKKWDAWNSRKGEWAVLAWSELWETAACCLSMQLQAAPAYQVNCFSTMHHV